MAAYVLAKTFCSCCREPSKGANVDEAAMTQQAFERRVKEIVDLKRQEKEIMQNAERAREKHGDKKKTE